MHVLSVLSLGSALFAAAAQAAIPARSTEPGVAALLTPDASRIIPGRYIVKLRAGADVAVASAPHDTLYSYNSDGFKGFAAALSEEELDAVRRNPDVEYVEQDYVVDKFEYLSQESAPWGLSRISHRDNGFTNYVYDSSAGEGTCVYIIDTGIKVMHEEFEGRAEWLQNFTDDGHDDDGAGHGTWVAGLVASRTYGVAKKARVFALKVFRDDGSADGAGIVAAMDFVAQEGGSRPGCEGGSAANMSLGGGYSQTSNDAADAMVSAGVFVAVAAGNSNVDAKDTSPASAPLVCTVGATDASDARASFSSFGDVVDVWAPGVNLESTSYEGGSTSASGTSGSSPLVAGLGAYLMAFEGVSGGLDTCQRIKDLAVEGVLTGLPDGSWNRLVNNGAP